MRGFLILIEITIGYVPIFLIWLAGTFMLLPFSITGVIVGEAAAYVMTLT